LYKILFEGDISFIVILLLLKTQLFVN